jgi:hypothetical protein
MMTDSSRPIGIVWPRNSETVVAFRAHKHRGDALRRHSPKIRARTNGGSQVELIDVLRRLRTGEAVLQLKYALHASLTRVINIHVDNHE